MATQYEVATHLDLSDRQVRNLVTDGILPASKGKGGMDLEACRMAYIRYLRGAVTGKVKPETLDDFEPESGDLEQQLTRERLRLTAAQADSQELKNETARGQVIPVDFMSWVLGKVVPSIASAFDTLPLMMRRRHPDMTPAQLATMEREAAKIRNECARFYERIPDYLKEFLSALE